MVKSVLGVNHQGLREWLLQRISAIILAGYAVFMVFFFACHPNVSYADWHGLFAAPWMKVTTMILISALLYHAWIGMWIIFTDYIKPFALRFILQVAIVLALVALFFAGLLILWGV